MSKSKSLAIAGFASLMAGLTLLGAFGWESAKVRPAQIEATATLVEPAHDDGYTWHAYALLEDGSVMEIVVDESAAAGETATYWILEETGEPLKAEIHWQIGDTPTFRVIAIVSAILAVISVPLLLASGVVKLKERRKESRPLHESAMSQ